MLTPQEVSTHAFTKAVMGGYNMAMVDEFLDSQTTTLSCRKSAKRHSRSPLRCCSWSFTQ